MLCAFIVFIYTSRMADFRLFNDRTMCVAGPSQSGKTTFLKKLLLYRNELFKQSIQRVLWCYGIEQPSLHSELQRYGCILYNGIPSVADLKPYDLVVLDDLLNESDTSKDLTKMFTQTAHHLPCFVIFVSQNLFPKGKDARTRSLNTHYYVIFKNPRDKSQIQVFARQVSPSNAKALIEIFEAATQEQFGYLFIDFTQECDERYRFRSNIFDRHWSMYKLQT